MKLTKIDMIGGVPIYRDDLGAISFKSGCTINADGSPHAYAPDNSGLTALDYLANAGSPGNWWGIACSGDEPFVQSSWHPAPGFYVSTTALCNPEYPENHPYRYVDSERYCFAVIPGGASFAKLGDVGLAYNQDTGDNMYFALGDVGPQDQIGECSMLLGRCLGLNPSPKTGGTSKRIINYVILPDSDPGYSDWEIKCKTAIKLVDAWGGLARLKQIAAEI
jgi:Fungal chitosanase of glycosyl hydrolase group 75